MGKVPTIDQSSRGELLGWVQERLCSRRDTQAKRISRALLGKASRQTSLLRGVCTRSGSSGDLHRFPRPLQQPKTSLGVGPINSRSLQGKSQDKFKRRKSYRSRMVRKGGLVRLARTLEEPCTRRWFTTHLRRPRFANFPDETPFTHRCPSLGSPRSASTCGHVLEGPSARQARRDPSPHIAFAECKSL